VYSITKNKKLLTQYYRIKHYECESADYRLENTINELHKNNNQHFIIVLNIGLHCHVNNEYINALHETFEYVEKAPYNMTFFYKQTSYQHFDTPSGEYDISIITNTSERNRLTNTKGHCVPHNHAYPAMYQDIEDTEIYLANQRYVLSNYTIRPINVLPFRYTIDLWDTHQQFTIKDNRRVLDCTHFKEYTPILHQPIFYTLYRHFLKNNSTISLSTLNN
jgi:hypothetical protein